MKTYRFIPLALAFGILSGCGFSSTNNKNLFRK